MCYYKYKMQKSNIIETAKQNILNGLKLISEMENDFEIWKAINGYDNYEVSTFGRVQNTETNKILKNSINGDGYYLVWLNENGKRKNFKVNRLVAIAFIKNPDNKPCVDHINNVRTDNHIKNLRWATNKENSRNASLSKNNTSGIKGVSWHKRIKKWYAHIVIDGISVHLGYFDDLEDAKQARIKKVNNAFGIYTNSCEQQ